VFPTNVCRLQQAFTCGWNDTPQIRFYFSGVGTRGDYTSAASGRGFDEIIIDAFVNLASNYMPGDQVYLFGFSRGAAAARALGGMISDPGLLQGDSLSSFPELWRYFLGTKLRAAERELLRSKLERRLIRPGPTVQFLGAFDAVAGSSPPYSREGA
jgi:uncharacterized protein (DUF2235 family)